MNYKGSIPGLKYAGGDYITINEYNEYVYQHSDYIWDLKSDTIKYCEQDCITLYGGAIIDKLNKKLFWKFKIGSAVFKYPTLYSIAFAISLRRTQFLGDSKIPLVSRSMFYNIKLGYTGGYEDVFKPAPDSATSIVVSDG